MENNVCPKCNGKLISKDNKLVCESCSTSFIKGPNDELIEEKVPEMTETSSGSNIDFVLEQIDKDLKEDNKNVRTFYQKLENNVASHPVSLEETRRIPSAVVKHLNNDQLPIFGSGFKNFKKKQKKIHEKELAKAKFEELLSEALKGLLAKFQTIKPGLYAPSSYNRIKKYYMRAKGEMESLSYEDDYQNSFKEINNDFIKRYRKVLTIAAARTRKIAIITGSTIAGAAAIGIVVCGAIPQITYEDNYGYYSVGDTQVERPLQEGRFGGEGKVATGIKGLFFPFHFPMSSVELPDYVNGVPVIGVSDYAFESKGITNVSFGTNIETIGECAFASNNLTSVQLEENGARVRSIGSSAFFSNPNLTEVTGLAHVRTIGDSAFYNCQQLTSVDTLESINQIGSYAFDDTAIDTIVIGEDAKSIAGDAFASGTRIQFKGDCLEWEKIYRGPAKTRFDNYIIRYINEFGYETLKKVNKKEKQFTLPVMSKGGYKFLGYIDENGTKITDSSGHSLTSFINSSIVDKPTPIDAKPEYKAIDYTVTFMSNGGSNVNDRTFNIEDNIDLSFITSSRPGYRFLGWYTSNYSSDKVTTTKGILRDITLYAKWEARTYQLTVGSNQQIGTKITYHYNDPNRSDKTVTAEEGSFTLENNLTRSNYRFLGWYLDSNLYNKVTSETQITGDVDLYAKWEYKYSSGYLNTSDYNSSSTSHSLRISGSQTSQTYQVSNSEGLRIYFKSNYGTPNIYLTVYDGYGSTLVTKKKFSSYNYNYIDIPHFSGSSISIDITSDDYYDYNYANIYFSNELCINIPKPGLQVKFGEDYTLTYGVKKGYKFVGYYTQDNGKGTKLTDENGKSLKPWDIDDDINVYPYYEVTNYSITYEMPEGVTNPNTKTVYNYGDTYTFSSPEKTGYTFEGWYKDELLTEKITSLDELYEDLVLRPKFSPIISNITLNGLDGIKRKVTFDYLDDTIEDKVVYLDDQESLVPPTELEGYSITWYKDQDLTDPFSFTNSSTISSDMTLYAKKTASSFSNPNNYPLISSVDSNSPVSHNVNIASYKYDYYIADKTASYKMYSKVYYSSSSYKIDLQVYNVTTGSTIIDTYETSTSYTSRSVYVTKGDIIKVIYRRYNYSNDLYYYFAEESNAIASINASQDLSVEYDNPFEVSVPTKPGSIFKGFYTEELGQGTKIIDENGKSIANSTFTTDTSLYAYFEDITYTITYNVESGITNPNASLSTYNYGDTTVLGDLEKTGYTFDGWYKDAALTQKVTSLSGLFGNLTLTPKFSPISVDLTLNGLSGTTRKVTFDYLDDTIEDKVIYFDNLETLVPPEELEGYQITWYKDPALTQEFDFSSNASIENDMTLYAKKTAYTFSNPDGYSLLSSVNETSPKSQYVSSSYSNYHYYIADKTTYIRMNAKTSTSGSYYYNIDFDITNVTTGTTLLTGTLNNYNYEGYKIFKVNKGDIIKFGYSRYNNSNTIYYYFEESSNAVVKINSNQTLTVEYDKPFEVSVPTKFGSTFKGFYTEENGLGTMVIDENGKSVSNSDFILDTNLYAHFEEVTYSVEYVFDAAHTNPNEALVSYKYGSTDAIQDLTVSPNFEFLGWYDNEACTGEPITSLTGLHKNLKLYAKVAGKKFFAPIVNLPSVETRNVTINYNLDGVENKVVSLGATEDLIIPHYNRVGYRVEWYLDADLTTRYNCEYNYYGDYTLYAKWIAVNNQTNDSVSKFTPDSPKQMTVNYDYNNIYLIADTDGELSIYYRVIYSSSMNLRVYNSSETLILQKQSLSSTNYYIKEVINVTKGELIHIKVDTNNTGSTNSIHIGFTTGSSYTASDNPVISVDGIEGIDLTKVQKDGYTFKGLYTQSNGQGTQVVNEQGKLVGEYSSGTLYAYYEAI